MASIQGYLSQLEARLAPSLDVHALQERLTEAENHLRDRAQEFEEVGLPPLEAEARAVAAFGDPEEYVVDVLPTAALTSAPVVRMMPRHDVVLQLSASALTLGSIASLLLYLTPLVAAGLAASLFVMFAALLGQITSLRRLSILSVAAAFGLFAVLMVAYVPGPNWTFDLRRDVEVRRQLAKAPQGLATDSERLRVFNRYETMAVQGMSLPLGPHGGVLAPTQDAYSNDLVEYFGVAGQKSARRMWGQNGELIAARLTQAASDANSGERASGVGARWWMNSNTEDRARAFAPLSVLAGILLLALLTGFQALGLALRGGLRRLIAIGKRVGEPNGSWNRR